MTVHGLLERYPIISDQISAPALTVVLEALEQTLNKDIPGDIAEFGCYVGTTSLFIRRILDEHGDTAQRTFYAYDSFDGLPAKTTEDQSSAGTAFQKGELRTSRREYFQTFKKYHLSPPTVIKGWFAELTHGQLPDQLAFAFLDGDFYQSIFDSLALVWPRLSNGGCITIDDYQREALPGVTKAVQQFFQGKTIHLHYEKNIGVIKKL